MTEQEIATFIDTYLNSVNIYVQNFCWGYFLSGFLFCLIIDYISDSVIKIIEKHKQKSKKEEDKNNSADRNAKE